jgi:hypothetical protein
MLFGRLRPASLPVAAAGGFAAENIDYLSRHLIKGRKTAENIWVQMWVKVAAVDGRRPSGHLLNP